MPGTRLSHSGEEETRQVSPPRPDSLVGVMQTPSCVFDVSGSFTLIFCLVSG